MDNTLLQLGGGGTLAILMIREVRRILLDRKEKVIPVVTECPNNFEDVATALRTIGKRNAKIGDQMEDIHRWHRPNDDGHQNWKFSAAMEGKFERVLDTLEELKTLNLRMVEQNGDQTDSLKTMTAALAKAINE